MSFHPLLSALLVALCCLVVNAVPATPSPPNINASTTAPRPAVTNSSGVMSTHSATVSTHSVMGSTHSGMTTAHSLINSTAGGKKIPGSMFNGLDGSMIQRALYVLIGITLIGVLYFLIRAVRLKRPAHRKKYGLLSDYDDSVEMDGMDSEEDDTLYEARSLRR